MFFKAHKVVSALPVTLEANTIYLVRVGSGFDLYATNSGGTIVAYKINTPSDLGSFFQLTNGSRECELELNASYQLVIGHNFRSGDNLAQLVLKYAAGGYGLGGIKLHDIAAGYETVLQQTTSGSLYITNAAGAAGSLTLGTRINPGDGSQFIAGYGFWRINTGVFALGPVISNAQLSITIENATRVGQITKLAASATADADQVLDSSNSKLRATAASGRALVRGTITPAGTTGAQTINRPAGRVNFAAGATSLVVTCDQCTVNCKVNPEIATNDSTMKSVVAVPGNGFFTLYPNAAPTGETAVSFEIVEMI